MECCRPTCRADCDGRTAADNMTVRNVFVVGPDKKVRLIIVYPMTHGAQLRRGPARHRLHAVDGQAQGRHAGELEAGRRRDHLAGRFRRRCEEDLSRRLEGACVPYLRGCAASPSRQYSSVCGSEGGPVTLPVFKTGDWQLRCQWCVRLAHASARLLVAEQLIRIQRELCSARRPRSRHQD